MQPHPRARPRARCSVELRLPTLPLGLVLSLLASSPAYPNDTPPPVQADLSPYALFHQPTPPIPLRRLIPEWEPHEAMILTLPVMDALQNPKDIKYYAELIKPALALMPVMINIDLKTEKGTPFLMQELFAPRARSHHHRQ